MKPFEQVVGDHGATVLRVCRAVVVADEVEDAWSETFLAALRAYPHLPEGSNVEAWLVTIARRKAIDLARARSRRAVPVDDIAGVEPAGGQDPGHDRRADEQELWDVIRSLPDKQRQAIAYHHLAGLPYQEVGQLLDSSEAAARRAAADGMKQLRKRYRVT